LAVTTKKLIYVCKLRYFLFFSLLILLAHLASAALPAGRDTQPATNEQWIRPALDFA
jgi:hypothetical protein